MKHPGYFAAGSCVYLLHGVIGMMLLLVPAKETPKTFQECTASAFLYIEPFVN